MTDSNKSSDEDSMFGKIFSSIEKINKIDSSDLKDEDEKKTNEGDSKKDNFADKLPLTSKADEFLSDDFKRKFPILAIFGTVIGVILIIFGIISMLNASERVVDSVASGETGTISIFIIFLGILFLGFSFLKFFAKKGPISNAFESLNDLKLLDENEFDDEKSDEKEQSAENNPESGNLDDLKEESDDLDNMEDIAEPDDLETNGEDLDLEEVLESDEGTEESLDDEIVDEELDEKEQSAENNSESNNLDDFKEESDDLNNMEESNDLEEESDDLDIVEESDDLEDNRQDLDLEESLESDEESDVLDNESEDKD